MWEEGLCKYEKENHLDSPGGHNDAITRALTRGHEAQEEEEAKGWELRLGHEPSYVDISGVWKRQERNPPSELPGEAQPC